MLITLNLLTATVPNYVEAFLEPFQIAETNGNAAGAVRISLKTHVLETCDARNDWLCTVVWSRCKGRWIGWEPTGRSIGCWGRWFTRAGGWLL